MPRPGSTGKDILIGDLEDAIDGCEAIRFILEDIVEMHHYYRHIVDIAQILFVNIGRVGFNYGALNRVLHLLGAEGRCCHFPRRGFASRSLLQRIVAGKDYCLAAPYP